MPDSLVQELKRWKPACPVSDYDLVFPSPEGKPSIHENVMRRYFYAALRRAGLRQVSFHSLRHTNASIRIQAGQNIKYLSTQLGHSSIKITLDIYGHWIYRPILCMPLLADSLELPPSRLEYIDIPLPHSSG